PIAQDWGHLGVRCTVMSLTPPERLLLAIFGAISVFAGGLLFFLDSMASTLKITTGVPLMGAGAILCSLATRPTRSWSTARRAERPPPEGPREGHDRADHPP